MQRVTWSRLSEVARHRGNLERHGWPRLQMSAIVIVTGLSGFLASYLLLQAGIETMPLRYPLAIAIAYAVFLLQMWAWMRWGADLGGEAMDAAIDGVTHIDGSRDGGWTRAGGRSGGGGSSASWAHTAPSGSDDATFLDAVDIVDHDAGLPLLAVLTLALVVLACAIAAGWVVWTAPALMAELLVDAAIAGGLYRRMQRGQAQGWWWLCVRHTFWPLVATLCFFVALGIAAAYVAPDAATLTQALQAL